MIVITGASGFIGIYLVDMLLNKGRKLFLCSHRYNIQHLFPGLKSARIDISCERQLKKLPSKGVEAVVHLASFIPPSVNRDTIDNARKSIESNIRGTLNVLEYARLNRIKRVVFASSISVYGDTAVPPDEEDLAYPGSFYGWSKLAAEMLCEKYRRDYRMDCFALRLGSVYGAGQIPNVVVAKFIHRAIAGEPIVIWGGGKKRVDFIYVKDVVNAVLRSLKAKNPGVYNIGSGSSVSIRELARCVHSVFSKKDLPPGGAKGRRCAVIFDTDKPEDTIPVWFNTSKAKKALRFQVKYSLLDGLRDYKRELNKTNKIS